MAIFPLGVPSHTCKSNQPAVLPNPPLINHSPTNRPLLFLLPSRKSRLKQNPLVSNTELNSISDGLGDEAEREGGIQKLGSSIGKAFD